MKTIVWGCGRKLRELTTVFPELIDRIDILVDRKEKSFKGRDVENPDILKTIVLAPT